MQVRVRFLSYLSSQVGVEQLEVTLPETAHLADLVRRLQENYPAQAALLANAAYLVNQTHTAPESVLTDGAQVLVLVRLSGG